MSHPISRSGRIAFGPVAEPRAKVFEYGAAVDRAGRISTGGGAASALGDEWSPDDLLLAALVRCSIQSLVFHARRAGIDVAAQGTARGRVTKPEGEERYRLVEADVAIEAELDPLPGEPVLAELLARAELDCFVGASLRVKPTYDWSIR